MRNATGAGSPDVRGHVLQDEGTGLVGMSEVVRSSVSDYAGDVAPREAWRVLSENPKARLVDVRTRAEWTYVGLPDLGAIGGKPLLVEWQAFPDMALNTRFAAEADALVTGSGGTRDAPVFLLCRSGARSRAAAIALTGAGYAAAYNVADGFEGDHDAAGHRGTRSGWKAEGLPWRQG